MPNRSNGWINYLNSFVSHSNGWIKISNGRANRSNRLINYYLNSFNGLLSRSNGWIKRTMSNRLVSCWNGWKYLLIHTIGLPIVRMNKLLKWFAKPFQAHGLIMERAMLLCIVFISFVVIVNFKTFILTIENGDCFNFSSK